MSSPRELEPAWNHRAVSCRVSRSRRQDEAGKAQPQCQLHVITYEMGVQNALCIKDLNAVCVTSKKNARAREAGGGELALLSITSSEPLRKSVLPVPTAPGYRNLESLVLKTGLFPLEDTACVPLNCKLLLPPGHFRLLVPRGQQARRCVTVLGHQEEGGLPLHSRT